MRVVYFVIFFSVGAVALGIAALCPELVGYYQNRRYVEEARTSLGRVERLDAQYGVLLHSLENDPNIVRKTAQPTLGVENDDPNTVYPRASAIQLAAARKALMEASATQRPPAIPPWLRRCRDPRRRCALFAVGSALILLSFVCFGYKRKEELEEAG